MGHWNAALGQVVRMHLAVAVSEAGWKMLFFCDPRRNFVEGKERVASAETCHIEQHMGGLLEEVQR